MEQMRLIDADELENEVIKRAFEGKLEWSVNDLKQLIRKQRTPDRWEKDNEYDNGQYVSEVKRW